MLHGDRGLIALRQFTQIVERTKQVHDTISKQRMILAKRVRLLYPNSLDPDMLEERARVMLNYGYADDIIVMVDSYVEGSTSLTQPVSFSSQN